jgi:peptidoglycan-associated lipoprotein
MLVRIVACVTVVVALAACTSPSDTSSYSGSGASGQATIPGSGPATAGQAAPGSEEELATAIGDRIYFTTDRYSVSGDARTTLNRQAVWLQQYPTVRVWIAGNCDDRGTEDYNLALGQRRANADRDYLISRGIDRSRMETISYGKDRPVDASPTPDGWAKNRNAITSVR